MRLAWPAVLLLASVVAGCGPAEEVEEPSRSEIQRFAGSASGDDAFCECWSNLYDCPSFPTSRAAQDCYEHCLELGFGDIHRLDRDRDGWACEWNPGGY